MAGDGGALANFLPGLPRRQSGEILGVEMGWNFPDVFVGEEEFEEKFRRREWDWVGIGVRKCARTPPSVGLGRVEKDWGGLGGIGDYTG